VCFANLVWASFIITLIVGAPAWANMVITPTYASNITTDPNAAVIEGAIQSAINVYEADFADPITVHITFQEMNTGLGSSNTSFFNLSYATYLAQLTADAKTIDDATAIAHLPTLAQYNALSPQPVAT